ncbi:MAG TPA: hypothetical protein VNW94_16930 [Streptosporangiaceae bacterium]|nr:hypothetical protein [Streptosporangiaceae bacterium]
MAATKQAVKVRGRRSARDVFAGLFALLTLSALVGGVPAGLLTVFGSPIPRQLPTMEEFTQQIGPTTLIHILVGLVWLAWAQLLICVLVEISAGVRGIGVPRRVPLAGGTQSLVHKLVVAALLLFTAASTVMPAFGMKDLHPGRTAVVQAQQREPVVQVVQGDAMRPMATMADTAAPRVDKAQTTKIYKVNPPAGRHHESLWEIAQKCLGEGRRYHEIYELNKSHQQPDGSHLHQASLIKPGWVLEMPADAVGAEVIQTDQLPAYFSNGHAVPAPRHAAPAPEHHHNKPAHKPEHEHEGDHDGVRKPHHVTPQHQQAPKPAPHQQVPAQSGQVSPEQNGQATPVPGYQAPPAQSGQTVPGGHQIPAGHTQQADTGMNLHLDWPEELAAASLLAAGLLVALGRRRRAQMWHRAIGHRLVRPEGEAARAEQALRIGADNDATKLLDLGLRQMSKSLAQDGRTLPTVYGVHMGMDSLDLWIAPADRNPPAPWEAYDDGQVWRLHHDTQSALEAADLKDVLAPYPGLISLGTNDTGRILADLEAAHGVIALKGPEAQRRAVLAAVAVELATNRWSDHMRITLVGFGEELQQIAPDRIRAVQTLSEALPELEGRAAEVEQALAASGADSVLTGRSRGVFGEAWMPHYLIMADQPSSAEAHRLVALARTGQRMAAGYLVPGEVPGAAWTWEVDERGVLQAGVLGFEVEAQVVPERHYRAVVDLFRTAGQVEGVALGDVRPATEPYGTTAGQPDPVVDIKVLGPVVIDAPGPIDDSRRALCTEVLVYLATHPAGVHPTVLGGAVWPRGVTAGVRDATIARVSDWTGRDSRGRPNLYYDDRGRIKLGSEVRIDWEVFRWLVWRSAAEPASETAYLSYAVGLVRGPLLAERPRGRYGWLASDELEYEATARVVDVAHRLVQLRAAEGDPAGAVTAAEAGLLFAAGDEGLWRDLLRALHATGDQTRLRTAIDRLRRRSELDPMLDQFQPETEALIEELMPLYRAVAARGA